LEPSPLKDLAVLSVANSEASQLQSGKDINVYRVVYNKGITVSKSNIKVAAPKPSTKPVLPSASKAPASAAAKASSAAAPASSAPASTFTADSKGKPGQKQSIMNFLGKGATAPSKATGTTTSSTTATKSSTLNFKPTQQKRKADSMMSGDSNDNSHGARDNSSEKIRVESSDDDVDSEEEMDRRLAMSSRLDQDQGHVVKEETESSTLKKRSRSSRLLAIDDDDEIEDEDQHGTGNGVAAGDDDEDESTETMTTEAKMALAKEKEEQRLALENMMLMDNDPNMGEDSPMVDAEGLGSTSTTAQNGATSTGRRRGHRTVTKRKTYQNERGYMGNSNRSSCCHPRCLCLQMFMLIGLSLFFSSMRY
jgi:hypothetical protein